MDGVAVERARCTFTQSSPEFCHVKQARQQNRSLVTVVTLQADGRP